MLKQFFKAMTIGRQGSAARHALPYLTDSHLDEMGFTRDTFVEGIQARVAAELDAAEAQKAQAIPLNSNLLGAVWLAPDNTTLMPLHLTQVSISIGKVGQGTH